jgi:ornithine cyclodeaminase/alanine dehydrogenase-like protein (mu-crystallin family)
LAVGAGAQVEAHVSLLLSLYPSLNAVCIANRSANPRAQATIESLARFATVQFTLTTLDSDLRSHIEAADIIVMATSSKVPLLGANEKHISKGAHIILVGSYTPDMHEVSSNLLERARTSGNGIRSIVVDSRSACLKEAGELISGGVEADEVTEIGELLHESSGAGYTMHEERCTHVRKAGEVTIFKSVGVGVQDVAIATHIFRKADEMGLGVEVSDYDK